MTKLGFTMTSLVAAIPGGFLCYFLIMVFLSKIENMNLMHQILAGGTLLIALLVTLIPFGVLVFFKSAPQTESDTPQAGTSTIEEDEEDLIEEDDDDSFEDDEGAEVDSFESDGEIAEATDDFDDEESDEFAFDDDMVAEAEAEAEDEFEDDDDEFDFSFDDDE